MSRVRVPIHGAMGKTATLDTAATEGAELGVNLHFNGRLLDPREVLNAYAPTRTEVIRGGGGGGGAATPGGDLTTDAVIEGSRKYFTAKRAQDAAGAILANTANVTLAYDGAKIEADLTTTGVTPGTYGDASHVVKLTVDAFGRVVDAEEVAGGGGIPDAPSDGKIYGRKDAAWTEVTSGGGGGEGVIYAEFEATPGYLEPAYSRAVTIPYGWAITGWRITGGHGESGSATFDVLAQADPLAAPASIVGTVAPSITGAHSASGSDLSGWTTTGDAGSLITFRMLTVGAFKALRVELLVDKT